MKKLLILPFFALFFSCEVEGAFTKPIATSPSATLIYTGDCVPTAWINVRGEAKMVLENETLQLELNTFSVNSGPNLKVYLSKSDVPNEFITLGNLTSASVYSIPNGVDFEIYTHVLIHCQQYNHLFTIATLTQN